MSTPASSSASLYSPIDSQRFGVRIGRSQVEDAAQLPGIVEQCHREQLRLLFARSPTSAVGAHHALEAAGGRLMDTLLYYRRPIRGGELPDELRPNRIRAFVEGDLAGVEAVARQCFAGYRGHYHADPALDRTQSDEAYVEWALSCCRQRSAKFEVLVAEDSAAAVCGFFVVRLNSPAEGEGWLAGVAPAAEGRGLYWSLLVHAMRWARERGAGQLIVSTQLTNLATQKTYGRLGFGLYASFHTFHLWLPPAPSGA